MRERSRPGRRSYTRQMMIMVDQLGDSYAAAGRFYSGDGRPGRHQADYPRRQPRAFAAKYSQAEEMP